MPVVVAFDQHRRSVVPPTDGIDVGGEGTGLQPSAERRHLLAVSLVEHHQAALVTGRIALGRVGSDDIVVSRLG